MKTIAILCAMSAAAYAGNNELDIGSSNRALRSNSADAVTSDSLGGGQVRYAHRFDAGQPDVVELWLGGAMEFGGAQGTMFQTMSTDLGSFAVLATARARYYVIDHVAATARVAFGSARASLQLSDNAGHTLSDSGWGAIGEAAAGIDLTAFEHSMLALGFRFELGYTRTTAPALTLRPPQPSDGTLVLPMNEASIGHLDLSGPFLAFSLVGQF